MDLKIIEATPPWEWPEDAGKQFLAVLRDEQADPSDRLLAADLAGDSVVINDELADSLLSILRNGDEPELLRGIAAISLGPVLELADQDGFEDFLDPVPITEDTFHKIQEWLRRLYSDTDVPKLVRRRILEASVRNPREWHQDAIRSAYASDDEDWKLTAVFCMRWVGGFDDQILQALGSAHQEIHFEAVCAAGNWGVETAWWHVAALVTAKDTDKPLRIAAIEAVAGIRPKEAEELLIDLTDSHDEDIAEAASDAMVMAGVSFDDEYDDEGIVH